MAIVGSVPVLACRHIEMTAEFYQQALHFVTLNQRTEGDLLEWMHLQNGQTSLMLERVNKDIPPGAAACRIYFFSDDIKSLHHYLIARGYQVDALVETNYRMHEFTLSDPEGNRLTIGQKLS